MLPIRPPTGIFRAPTIRFRALCCARKWRPDFFNDIRHFRPSAWLLQTGRRPSWLGADHPRRPSALGGSLNRTPNWLIEADVIAFGSMWTSGSRVAIVCSAIGSRRASHAKGRGSNRRARGSDAPPLAGRARLLAWEPASGDMKPGSSRSRFRRSL